MIVLEKKALLLVLMRIIDLQGIDKLEGRYRKKRLTPRP